MLKASRGTSRVEERDVNVWEKEEQRDTEKCCVILSKLSPYQPSVVLPGEVVSNVSSDLFTRKPVGDIPVHKQPYGPQYHELFVK